MPHPTQHRTGLRLFVASLLGMLFCLGLAGARLRGLLLNSALLAGGAIAVSVPLGTLLAIAVAKTSMPGRRIIWRLMIALLFVPLVVQAAAWQAALGHNGWFAVFRANTNWFDGWLAAIWVHGIAAIPWVVLAVGAALNTVARELEEEALQDAPAWRVVLRVSLRRAASAVIAVGLWVAVICFGEIAVTDLFQIRTFAEEVYTAASLGIFQDSSIGSVVKQSGLEDVPQLVARDLWLGTAAVLMLILAALAAVWSCLSAADTTSPSEPWIWRLRTSRITVTLAAWCLVAGVVGAPMLSLLGKAGVEVRRVDETVCRDWSARKAATMVFRSPWEHRRELGWSAAIGGLAAATATIAGVGVAWSLRTAWLPTGPTALLLALGFAIPGPLLGVWLIRVLNHPPGSMFSMLTWCYDHTILAPVLAQFFRVLPLATLVLWSQLATIPQDVLDSATSEGAGWWRRLFGIAIPLRWPAVVAAVWLSLIVAIGDLAATLLVSPPGVSTLSVRIFGLLHYGAEDRVSALCLALAVALGLLAILTAASSRGTPTAPEQEVSAP